MTSIEIMHAIVLFMLNQLDFDPYLKNIEIVLKCGLYGKIGY